MLELFSGIGAVSAALAGHAEVVGAVDQHAGANATYLHNWHRPPEVWNLAGVKAAQLAKFDAELWWMSPPCQPFTVRGLQRDIDDPRCAALLRVLELVRALRPPRLALENVPGFLDSNMRIHLRSTLEECGYTLEERVLCPTELGVPMLRRRYYLCAWRNVEGTPPNPPEATMAGTAALERASSVAESAGHRLADYLDPEPEPALYLDPDRIRGFGHSATVLSAENESAVATCFTSAYGRSPVRAGAYVRDALGVRRFSPAEVLRLLGFPAQFAFPPAIDAARRWELAGNSLSVDAVRTVLSRHIPTLAGPAAP